MFCREQVAQLRDALPRIAERGAGLTLVGNGSPAMAAVFRGERAPELSVLVDPGREAYRALELKRSVGATFSWATIRNARRTWRAGFRQGRTQGDPWQQGGVFVVGPGPVTRYAHVSQAAGDHPPIADVLDALA